MAATGDIRNVILLGHAGSGKTSLTEAILHTTGAVSRLGSVDEKTSVSDYYDEEKEHGHSILSAIVHTQHNGKLINVIDTPGAPDFVGPAIAAMPAAETAVIVINAASGIETNTRKLFHLAGERGKARVIVINKMQAENVDMSELIGTIQETFGSQCRCANLPAEDRNSVVDCVEDSGGSSPVMDVAQAHTELVESVIEADDAMMERYLGGEAIKPDEIAAVFVKALRSGTLTPIIFTEARQEIGIKELLDLVAKDTPSPAEAEPAKLVAGDQITELTADPSAPLAGVVFRVTFDPRSNMKYSSLRIFSGTLKSDTNLMHNDEKKGMRPGHVLKVQGSETKDVDAGVAGDIVTLAKVEELRIGDLIHDGRVSGTYEMPTVPEPMFALALEPASRGDEQKIGGALDRLREEDPCFKITRDAQTKELVAHGLGDLHLRVMIEKMQNRFKLSVNTKEPKIPYRETITNKAEGHYRHKKQTGGAGQFGEVYLRVEPLERGAGFEFVNDIFGGSIPQQFLPAIEKGIRECMDEGVVAGYPVQDVRVSVYDGKYHPVDSKEIAFKIAGRNAFKDGVAKARPILLEPIVDLEVMIPASFLGDVTGDLNSRRGRIQGMESGPGGMQIIRATAPLAEVAAYNTQLRSATGGQGSYSMSFSHYEPVPGNVQQKIVAAYAAAKQDKED